VPTFSVIIAAYRAAGFVAGAIESALEQSVPPLEVIICDDGSGDDIEEALEPYGERITLLRQEHRRGQSAAQNTALRAASGDFISFLDHDDAYLPERIEAVGELSSARPDLDILATNCLLEVDGRVIGDAPWRFEVGDQRRALLWSNFIPPNVAVRRTRLIEVGGFDEALVGTGDWDCWLRLVFSGSLVGQVDRPLSRYRVHEEALSTNKLLMTRAAVKTLEKVARTLEMSSAERSVLARSLAHRRRLANVEDAREALRRGRQDARRRSLAIAAGRGYGIPTRVKAALAAAAPRAVRRVLLARERKRWVGAAEVVVPRRLDARGPG
jgi:glycosyltransferase involved in cell wall biosynthesis